MDTLRRYVRADLALLEAVQPDVVVGDFRISLGVSARVAGVPYLTITNAYGGRIHNCHFRCRNTR